MKQLFISVGLLLATVSYGQTPFYKQFSSNGYDYANGVCLASDSSYFVTGASSSFAEMASQMFVLKTDSLGTRLWSRSYGGDESDIGVRIKELPTGELFVGGYTTSFGEGAYDIALWKLDANGEQVWLKTFGTSSWERMYDMILTPDNGLIMVGETKNTDDGYSDIVIIRVDTDGEVVWQQQVEKSQDDIAFTVFQYDANTFLVGGYKTNETTLLRQMWVARYNWDGSTVFDITWGDDNHYDVRGLSISDADIVTAGGKFLSDESEHFMLTTRISAVDGTMIFANEDQVAGSMAVGIARHGTSTQEFNVAVLHDGAFTFGEEDILFYKFQGYPFFLGNVGSVQYLDKQFFGQVIPGYGYQSVAVGSNQNVGPGGSSAFLVRFTPGDNTFNAQNIFSTEPLVGINKLIDEEIISIYPNPAKDYFAINFSEQIGDVFTIRMIDQIGREVINRELNGEESIIVNSSTMVQGLYIVIVETSIGTAVKKLEIR